MTSQRLGATLQVMSLAAPAATASPNANACPHQSRRRGSSIVVACAAQSELLGLVSPFASPSRPPPLAVAGLMHVSAERSSSRGSLSGAPSTPVKIVPRVRLGALTISRIRTSMVRGAVAC